MSRTPDAKGSIGLAKKAGRTKLQTVMLTLHNQTTRRKLNISSTTIEPLETLIDQILAEP